MQREKKCGRCKQYFVFDDDAAFKRCPVCFDSCAASGYTYLKRTILRLFHSYLEHQGVSLSEEERLNAMKNYSDQTMWNIYNKGTYTTFNVFAGEIFQQHWQVGPVKELVLGRRVINQRIVTCIRCGKYRVHGPLRFLSFYLGIKKKYCRKCDSDIIPRYVLTDVDRRKGIETSRNYHRNGGSKPSEYSVRARAKALNVSVSDYRRGQRQPMETLPDGTIIGNLIIEKSYWDDRQNQWSPKYIVKCVKCGARFSVLQKRVKEFVHQCK